MSGWRALWPELASGAEDGEACCGCSRSGAPAASFDAPIGRLAFPGAQRAELRHYDLFAWVIMPNHVHVVLEPRAPLQIITRALKGVSARHANATLGRASERFWQDESFDHWIRNGSELERVRSYVERNPVKAGLATRAEDWLWSSARR